MTISEITEAVHAWIREDAPITIKMRMEPQNVADLVRRVAALRGTPASGAEAMREAAEAFARRAHAGQVDKAGLPYTGHLGRVAARARAHAEARGWSATNVACCEAVGWLHDAIEDDRAPAATINREFDPTVAYAVGALTRDPDETYADYIQGIVTGTTPIVRVVKLADLEDNLDPARGASLPDSQRQRYERAREALLRALPTTPASSATPEATVTLSGAGLSGGRDA